MNISAETFPYFLFAAAFMLCLSWISGRQSDTVNIEYEIVSKDEDKDLYEFGQWWKLIMAAILVAIGIWSGLD
ncbi:MAG: hypothetical protein ABJP02_13175 [Parasphingorhabdus sp.]|uniref:hypothetical protein n=1 Tax=Parasphingorhabdus sp. TaxID=2709688 RepID=UPI00329937FA